MRLFEKISNLFTDHPDEVGETYWEHMREALTISSRMYCCCVAQAVHAIFPFVKPPRGTDIKTMKQFCHNHTPEERQRKKNRIIISEIDTTYKR
tara:strand:+ start:2548 stop:2829 length:282 start_codon:yes stop_codon:yes gene_type:complete